MEEEESANIFEEAAKSSSLPRKRKSSGPSDEEKREIFRALAKARDSRKKELEEKGLEKATKKRRKQREKRLEEHGSKFLEELADARMEDKELEALFHRVKEGLGKIDKQVDEACAENGVSRSDFESYRDNPDNFSPDEWNEFQEIKKDFRKRFKIRTKKLTKLGKKGSEARGAKGSKGRKGKTIGGRRGWIPM